MLVGMERYTELLQDFGTILQAYIDEENLNKLRDEYKNTINSKRVLESIVDINSLLNVLEKRGVLQYDQVSVLYDIAQKFVHDQPIAKLISNYEQWLSKHSSEINYLYNCGKSSNLINNYGHNTSDLYKTENTCDIIYENVPVVQSEEQCNKRLLNESCNDLNLPQFIEKRNIFSSMLHSKKLKKKLYIFAMIATLLLLLLTLTISVIGIFVKLYYLSAATISPQTEPQTTTTGNQFEPKMPLFMPNRVLATPSVVDHEIELQDLVIKKLSRHIGRYWAEVCRRLNIEESDINDLENRFMNETHSYEKMFKEALKIYFSKNQPNWKIQLMRALESSRRKDLKEIVEEMVL